MNALRRLVQPAGPNGKEYIVELITHYARKSQPMITDPEMLKSLWLPNMPESRLRKYALVISLSIGGYMAMYGDFKQNNHLFIPLRRMVWAQVNRVKGYSKGTTDADVMQEEKEALRQRVDRLRAMKREQEEALERQRSLNSVAVSNSL